MTAEEFNAEYERLGHAIQTGIALAMDQPGFKGATPKHLRTGLDLVMRDHGSLGRLLLRKGVITQDEYFAAILDGLREEKAFQEAILLRDYGLKVTLA